MATKKASTTPAKKSTKPAAAKEVEAPKPPAKTAAKKAPAKTATKATSAAETPETKSAAKKSVSHEEIAKHAYGLWEKSGHHHGSHVDHWLHAEKELSS